MLLPLLFLIFYALDDMTEEVLLNDTMLVLSTKLYCIDETSVLRKGKKGCIELVTKENIYTIKVKTDEVVALVNEGILKNKQI